MDYALYLLSLREDVQPERISSIRIHRRPPDVNDKRKQHLKLREMDVHYQLTDKALAKELDIYYKMERSGSKKSNFY